MALQIGESIGHYQVVEELGVGGNGRVLKVQHLITRRREAMKILANGRPTSKEYAHRVLREIRLQASLDHPNIAAVLNAFWLEDDLVMIMELIEGVTLQKILEQRRLNLDQSINVIRQVLLALSFAHSSGVIHRDVSTANIIVGDDGRVKLTDFGLAKGSADLSVTESGGMIGSPYYISPEQVRSNTACDQRSDIYSTGVVLYELLTGNRPFENESTFLLMQAHVQHLPQPPLERNPALPQYISEAILKALAKKPADRYQNAADFLTALEGPMEQPAPSFKAPQAAQPAVAAPIQGKTIANPIARAKFVLPKVIQSPIALATLGIGIVIAAVAPVFFYNSESGRPRFAQSAPLSLPTPASQARVPDSKATEVVDPEASNPGPKALPTLPAGNGGIATTQQGSVRKASVPIVPVRPPKIMVWGEARTAGVSKSERIVEATPPPQPAPAVAMPKQLEEPPSFIATSPSKSAIEPAMPQPGTTIQRKGLLRRLANGVKALNPIRKDNPVQVAPLASKP